MNSWWQVLLSVLGGLLVIWLLAVGALLVAARRAPDPVTLKGGAAPSSGRSPSNPQARSRFFVASGRSVALWALLGYLLMPIDLVPDFIPVVGYADDAVVIALVLRSVTRAAGPDALDRHWPGSPEGLAAIRGLLGF